VTVWTYLTQLGRFGHIAFQAFEQASVVGEEGAISAPTATSRARNVASTVCFHRLQRTVTAGQPLCR
jgi:hypothetical protein